MPVVNISSSNSRLRLFTFFPAESDNRIPVDEVTKRDYRLLVKNKDLRRFVKRFNKTSC
jgi:hypothetical protein